MTWVCFMMLWVGSGLHVLWESSISVSVCFCRTEIYGPAWHMCSLLTRRYGWVKEGPGYWYGKQFLPSVCVPRAKLALTTSSLCSLSSQSPRGETQTRNSHRLSDRSCLFLTGWHCEPSRINLPQPPESSESGAEAIREFMKMDVRMTSACSITGFKRRPELGPMDASRLPLTNGHSLSLHVSVYRHEEGIKPRLRWLFAVLYCMILSSFNSHLCKLHFKGKKQLLYCLLLARLNTETFRSPFSSWDLRNFLPLTTRSCSLTRFFHFGTCCSWTRVQVCVVSKSFTFSLLCGADCTRCVDSCAIICVYSTLVYSLYNRFQAVSCWNLSKGRLQRFKPISNANMSSCGVWPVDVNVDSGTEKESRL